jgi:hypothetical protein
LIEVNEYAPRGRSNTYLYLVTMRMPRCFTSKVEGNMRIGVKYFNDDDVVSNKAIQ